MARAAATAYEVMMEYLGDTGDRIVKAIDPLKMKQKKLNLSTNSDEEVSCTSRVM